MNLLDPATLRSLVTLVALAFSITSFASFIWGFGGSSHTKIGPPPPAPAAMAPAPVTVADLALLFEAIAKLGDALVRAGPALWRLLAAALFLLIAALSTGVFEGAPAPPSSTTTAAGVPGSDPRQNLNVDSVRRRASGAAN